MCNKLFRWIEIQVSISQSLPLKYYTKLEAQDLLSQNILTSRYLSMVQLRRSKATMRRQDENLQQEVLENTEHIKGHTSGIKVTRLLRKLSDDEMDDNNNDTPAPSSPSTPTSSVDPRKPWLHNFNYYVNTFDQLAENQSIVRWWGDFLAIMASSVLTLTITKRQNHLKEDVVKTLQVMKCLLHHDLVFCEPGPLSLTEGSAEEDDELLEGDADETGIFILPDGELVLQIITG
ncbi:hypothetical protein P692DRAFT_20821894 [Suillus brevipes Sb2]|nr:hypothetical protein P692DRAFT_20821894 [Suillus brevipes Sb2]